MLGTTQIAGIATDAIRQVVQVDRRDQHLPDVLQRDQRLRSLLENAIRSLQLGYLALHRRIRVRQGPLARGKRTVCAAKPVRAQVQDIVNRHIAHRRQAERILFQGKHAGQRKGVLRARLNVKEVKRSHVPSPTCVAAVRAARRLERGQVLTHTQVRITTLQGLHLGGAEGHGPSAARAEHRQALDGYDPCKAAQLLLRRPQHKQVAGDV